VKLLDTNVFVYAEGKPDRNKDACVAILAQAQADPVAYGVDVEALQEILDLYSRRGERREAIEIVDDVLTAFPDPFPITRTEIEAAADIVGVHTRLSPRDAIHAAVVMVHGLEGVVSADKAFDRLPTVTRFDPLKLAEA
jgi:predicted nucleic acid-binding protein